MVHENSSINYVSLYGGLKKPGRSTKQASLLQFTVMSSAVHGDRRGLAAGRGLARRETRTVL